MNTTLSNIHLSDFPEKISITETSGGKVQIYMYGPKSYDNQLAVITHYLHNREFAKGFSIELVQKYLTQVSDLEFKPFEHTL